jgi:hypothetical protein
MDIIQPENYFNKNKDLEKNCNNMIIKYSKDFIKNITEIIYGDKLLFSMIIIALIIYISIGFTIMTFK